MMATSPKKPSTTIRACDMILGSPVRIRRRSRIRLVTVNTKVTKMTATNVGTNAVE